MTEIKLILADLDGTVVQPEAHSASGEVKAAIREAEEMGVKFAAITGRPYWMAKDLLRELGFVDPCVFEGGAVIINPATDEVLWSKNVPFQTTRQAVEILRDKASIIEFGKGAVKANDVDLSSITEPALSIWASVPTQTVDEHVHNLKKLPEVAVHSNDGPGGDFSRTGIQVTHFEADKEHSVRELLRLFSVDKEHTLAIGDGDNDIPLFRGAKIKIAMGNASALLKAEADEIVPTVSEDGFAKMIRKFIVQQ
jgi:HAD superfamily hydrolase (TIGR01484 family)